MFDIIIVYWNGTKKIVNDVNRYGLIEESGVFYILKNNIKSYIPKDFVRFFGLKDHWECAKDKESPFADITTTFIE